MVKGGLNAVLMGSSILRNVLKRCFSEYQVYLLGTNEGKFFGFGDNSNTGSVLRVE